MIYLCTYKSSAVIQYWFYYNQSIYSVSFFPVSRKFIFLKDNIVCKKFVYKKYVPDRVWNTVEVSSNKPDLENIILNKIIYGLES